MFQNGGCNRKSTLLDLKDCDNIGLKFIPESELQKRSSVCVDAQAGCAFVVRIRPKTGLVATGLISSYGF